MNVGWGDAASSGGKGADVPSDNLYIKGLPIGTNESLIQQVFGAYGTVLSCKVLSQPEGATNAAAMVRLGSIDQASWLVQNLNGNIPQGLSDPITVKFANSPAAGGAPAKGTAGMGGFAPAPPAWNSGGGGGGADEPQDNLYIKGLPVGITEDMVREVFGAYGNIASLKVLNTPDGADNAAALVRFGDTSQAQWLVDNLNGNIPKGLAGPVTVRYANPKGGGKGKEPDPRYTPYGGKGGTGVMPPGMGGGGYGGASYGAPATLNFGSGEEGSNLYIRGLPQTADDLYLYKVFAPIGAILSVKSIQNPTGQGCAGYGFVKYSTTEEANKAIGLLSTTPLPDGTMLQVSVKTDPKGGKGKGKSNGGMVVAPGGAGGGDIYSLAGLAGGDLDAAAALAALS